MLLTNKSARLVILDAVQLIPGQTSEVDEMYKNHPVVAAYIQNDILAVGAPVPESKPEKNPEKKEEPKLESKTKEALKELAKERGIDITGAETKDDIIALLKAAK